MPVHVHLVCRLAGDHAPLQRKGVGRGAALGALAQHTRGAVKAAGDTWEAKRLDAGSAPHCGQACSFSCCGTPKMVIQKTGTGAESAYAYATNNIPGVAIFLQRAHVS